MDKLDNPLLKDSCKLLDCQKEMLIWWRDNKGISYAKLGLMFRVSKAMAYFICNPVKLSEYRKANSYIAKSNSEAVKKWRKKLKSLKKIKQNV